MDHPLDRLPNAQSLLEPSSNRVGLGIVALLIMGSVVFSKGWCKANPLADIPSVGRGSESARRREFLAGGAQRLYAEGYQKARDSEFILQNFVLMLKIVQKRNFPHHNTKR